MKYRQHDVGYNSLHICHYLHDIHGKNVHDLDLDLHNRSRSTVNMQLKEHIPGSTSNMMTMKIFAISVTNYKIFAKIK